MEAITSTLTEVLVNVALAAITLLGAYALYYLGLAKDKVKAQAQQIEDEKARKLLEDAVDDVDYLARVTVGALEQTTAGALRELVKAGTVDREKLLEVGRDAFDKIKSAITPEAQRVITENLGSFDDFVLDLIEQKVGELKTQKAIAEG